ncbi:urease accessory protein UreD [Desulfosporosinus sp. SB140]|uniref:urease accessory protein UreD n=1 Tax=Desulfosporosinus paludis TaxID=3115649 RepID=UPI00388E6709
MLGISDLSQLPGKRGELKLRLGPQDGRTVIKDIYNRVPLKVAKPFYFEPETGEIFIYQMNPAGGMVQGDNYHLELDLEAEARVFLTTQSATKVYRSPDSFACQLNLFKLGSNSILEYFPDPVIPFAGSNFVGETEVYLHQGSVAFLSEVVTPGRVKSDEVFQFQSYHSKTKVYFNGDLIFWDNWRIIPSRQEILSLGMYDQYIYQGNLYIFSENVSQDLADRIHQICADKPHLLASASLTTRNGIAVRLLSNSSLVLEKAITSCWDLARQKLLGQHRPRIRKY